MKRTYPYKGIYKGDSDRGLIVEFSKPFTGTVIDPGITSIEVGHFSAHWTEDKFTELIDLEFPFMIEHKSIHERDAAAAWLISKGCLVHGKQDHLNGVYKKYFDPFTVIVVESPNSFSGDSKDSGSIHPTTTFFEDIDIINKALETEVIKKGDWVVAVNSVNDSYIKGNTYQVRDLDAKTILTVKDSKGRAHNGWQRSNFRKAKEHEIPKLPIINNYEGKIEGDDVVYGCARIGVDMIKKLHDVMDREQLERRRVVSVKLNSGVEITKEQIDQIAKVL